MRILVYCPMVPDRDGRKRIHPLTLESIMALETVGQTAFVFDRDDTPNVRFPYMDVVRKYTRARHMMLDGGYDALLTVEADMIVPPDTIKRLAAIDTDVAYGLYSSRHEVNAVWLAFAWIRGNRGKSISLIPDKARAAWGNVIGSQGVGLGCTLALFCDVIFAKKSAYLSDPHVSVGMVAGDGGAVIWPQLVGYARAKEFLMTGDRVSAERAAEIGLINHAVEDGEFEEAVDTFSDRMATSALEAVRWSKVSVNIGLRQLAHSMMDASLAYEALTNISEDHQEALNAMRDKRKPVFASERSRGGKTELS